VEGPAVAGSRRLWPQVLEVEPVAVCVECEADIDVDEFDVDRDDLLSCPDCGANLRVVELAPVVLARDAEAEASEEASEDDGDDDEWD
jgi:hypothetical protein